MRKQHKRMYGFTIVELLIVVVVIAILAAITIVAYNGIVDRAKASAAQSLVSQTARKLNLYAADNNDQYPSSLAAAGITNTDGLQYTGGGASFCITGSSQNVSYYQSNTVAKPTAGACAGHGVNGVAAIINYAQNPTFTNDINFMNQAGASPAGSTVSLHTSGHNGSTSFKRSITTSGQTGASAVTPSSGAYRLRVNANETLSWSFWIYSTRAGSIIPFCDSTRVVDGTGTGLSYGAVNIPATTWTKVSATVGAPVDMYITQCGGYALSVQSGDTVYFDEYMINLGSIQSYADGNSPGWVWNAVANGSTSTGPPL